MFGGVGMWEIILVFMVVLLLFGAKRLPEIGSSLGKGIREFKGSIREIEGEFKVPEDEKPLVRGAGAREAEAEARNSELRDSEVRDSEVRNPDDEGNGEPRRLTTSG